MQRNRLNKKSTKAKTDVNAFAKHGESHGTTLGKTMAGKLDTNVATGLADCTNAELFR